MEVQTILAFVIGVVVGFFIYPIWIDSNKPPTPEI